MTLTTNEKIIIGATVTIGVSTLVMVHMTKKYEEKTIEVISTMNDINHTLSKSREDIIAGNRSIEEGNKMLREMYKQNMTATKRSTDEKATKVK